MSSESPTQSRTIVAHPYLFGLFPLFSLLSANLAQAEFSEAFLPAVVVLAIALVASTALRPFVPQPHKRGLVVSLVWIPFFGFGSAVDAFRAWLDFRDMIGPGALAALALLAGAALLGTIYVLRRSPWSFAGLTLFLNRVSAFALSAALAACALAATREPDFAPEPMAEAPPDLALPDIYYIVLDAYPRADVLKTFFGYDNAPFLEQLRDRGFYIAERSRSNYGNTQASLASILNLDYLDPGLVPRRHFETVPELLLMVRDNLVIRTLKSNGYAIVDMTLGLFGGDLAGADRVVRPRITPYTEYQQHLIDHTPVRSLLNRLTPLRSHRSVPYVLDALGEIRRTDRPVFVYAHLYAPHTPHSYDTEGYLVDTLPPYKAGMRTTITFLNSRLKHLVDSILARAPDSVIVIQGDHGCNASLQSPEVYASDPLAKDWDFYARDRSANLNAILMPGRALPGALYPDISSVNTFRVLFNEYFGADYPLLEDVTYLRSTESFEIVPVTGDI